MAIQSGLSYLKKLLTIFGGTKNLYYIYFMKNNKQKEVSVRDVRNLVDYTEERLCSEFGFTLYPEATSVNCYVIIEEPEAWAQYLIEHGAPDFKGLMHLQDKRVVRIDYESAEWEGVDDDTLAEELQELYSWNEDGTIDTSFVI